jgi:hypothetical protein
MAGIAATNLTNVNASDTFYGLLHAGGQSIPPIGQVQIYDGYGTPTALQLGANCNGATICGTLSATSVTLTQKLSASTDFDIYNLLNVMYPVNSVLFTYNNVNPDTRSGWGSTTWTLISQGRFIVGVGTGTDSRGESKTFIPGNNTGEYNHILTQLELPSHTHGIGNNKSADTTSDDNNTGIETNKSTTITNPLSTQSAGGNQPHNTTPPGFGLYVWQRTA